MMSIGEARVISARSSSINVLATSGSPPFVTRAPPARVKPACPSANAEQARDR